jgi:hypothetical protein
MSQPVADNGGVTLHDIGDDSRPPSGIARATCSRASSATAPASATRELPSSSVSRGPARTVSRPASRG